MTTHAPSIARPFNDLYLLAYSGEHVFYEVDMFFGMADLLSRPSHKVVAPSVEEVTRVNSALVEAFGIHFRNVVEFLYIDPPKPTDVVAADFFDPNVWQGLRPAMSSTIKAARIRANKEIVHLTTDRVPGSPPQKAWDFGALADEIRPLMRLVVEKALATRLSPEVAAVIR